MCVCVCVCVCVRVCVCVCVCLCVHMFVLTDALDQQVHHVSCGSFDSEVLGGQVGHKSRHDSTKDGDEGIPEEGDHGTERLQGAKVDLAVPVCQPRAKHIKHLY